MLILEEILENWMIAKPYSISEVDVIKYENRKPNAWIINENYVLKRFTNPDYMKRGIEITRALAGEGIPVAVPVETKARTEFIFIAYFARNGYPQLADTNIKMLT